MEYEVTAENNEDDIFSRDFITMQRANMTRFDEISETDQGDLPMCLSPKMDN